ncbi:MBL fold metallo-hydrolase [Verminephrobacter aporrectodeae]|uniref:MBL fold metallo-hydrolase n=1 Tax=Verminephrobacter aporrectodeae TaxID=1110389 RepID=UPI002238B552|nr:MBL fold metallo-hydrolase [Verminephrobacter aporrectodeae]MCW5255580.1 hypothetical protein [Verminephrobacter aporrectodeae subsp. tuberculatae]MCW8177586.1 hypothetical protein [Verminephrobacter aporrectodeae subsp. tuberculatae]MCW8205054.1 hypothetical protein [Verminephrobacter aporrectodeae subsp. tuberculatae]
MRLTFIGHQSWHIHAGVTNVLVDPLLGEGIGNSGRIVLPIFPPRTVHTQRMSPPDLVVLTHEHPDHFDLASLSQLDPATRVVVGPTLPSFVCEAIEALGLTCRVAAWQEPMRIGALEMRLYPAGRRTPAWEDRVAQPLFSTPESTGPRLFVAADATVSELLLADVKRGRAPSPNWVVVSNNSQIPPSPAYDNLLAGSRWDRTRFADALPLLSLLAGELTAGLKDVADIVLCGNGFLDPRQRFGPFLFSDHPTLAAAAAALRCGGPRLHGPIPGDVLDLTGDRPPARADWVEPDGEGRLRLLAQQQAFLTSTDGLQPMRPVLADNDGPAGRAAVEAVVDGALPGLARAILAAPLGHALALTHEHLGRSLDARRFVLRLLRSEATTKQYALDLRLGSFVRDDCPSGELLSRFPFGAELFLCDLAAVLTGDLQAWDIAGVALRSWHLGDPRTAFTPLLFHSYGEHVRPDLARRALEPTLARLAARK